MLPSYYNMLQRKLVGSFLKDMKKIIIGLFILLAFGERASAQIISVANIEALPGEIVAFSMNLQDGKTDTYTALSFNVHFPLEGFSTTGDYAISSLWKDAIAVVGDIDKDGGAIIPLASANEVMGDNIENLVTVSFKVDESVALGEYEVSITNIMFEYGFAEKDYTEDIAFKVNVVSTHQDDTPTGITERKTTYKTASYDLQGRRVEKSLQKGLYIKGRKKVVVR